MIIPRYRLIFCYASVVLVLIGLMIALFQFAIGAILALVGVVALCVCVVGCAVQAAAKGARGASTRVRVTTTAQNTAPTLLF